MKPQNCKFCSSSLDVIFVDLGMSPLANSFLNQEMLNKKEPFYPLRAYICSKCFLVQLEEFERPENIFTNYVYFSSFSESWLKHAEKYVDLVTTRFGFNHNSQVVEIASNDGYLLQFFKRKNIPVLGIEPASNIAKVARNKGISTIEKFFGTQLATELIEIGKSADLLIGNNVLAHVPNLNDFVSGLKILLKLEGIVTMEFPHLLRLIQQNQFDTIYHEHFSYFSLMVTQKVFAAHKLEIFDVEELPTHGGSLRIYVKHEENNTIDKTKNVSNIIQKEKKFGLDDISTYTDFSRIVKLAKQKLREFLFTAKKENKKVVGYGAPAKGNTLLNYCEVGVDLIEYTVDRSPYKQKLYLPGTHIPVKNPEIIRETKPDYVLILPWNLREEIIEQLNYIRKWNGKFVVPIPEVKIYS